MSRVIGLQDLSATMQATALDEANLDPTALWYDRSSITADAMVMIANQTPEDFERFAPESRFCDYIDGVIYLPAPVTERHQEVALFIMILLRMFRDDRNLPGKVLTGPAVVRISDHRKVEPDVFVRPLNVEPSCEPSALLVVEILSKSTREHDLGLKLRVYREALIPEIVLVDAASDFPPTVYIERLVEGGYQGESLVNGRWISTALPGFWLDVAWLRADPMPNLEEIRKQVLRKEPLREPDQPSS